MDLWVFCLEPNIIQEKRTAIREIENSCLEFIFKLEGILCHIIAKEENRRTRQSFRKGAKQGHQFAFTKPVGRNHLFEAAKT